MCIRTRIRRTRFLRCIIGIEGRVQILDGSWEGGQYMFLIQWENFPGLPKLPYMPRACGPKTNRVPIDVSTNSTLA
jgi:hypothetical protein